MAESFSNDIMMNSLDLTRMDSLDYGGFGEVYLCNHKTMGYVVLKTVYTGPLRDEQKQSLLREGKLMNKLDHKRIVKLLGVVLEDGHYSLVMELIPKGNLLLMLQKVVVPISIQGRIILEILEGMVYLSQNQIIHKDLKPENILVDDNFHVKIADLGLATCQTWSRLTREESRRQSRSREPAVRMAGTLCYMAPEHLQSLNNPSTEKSDIYSFAIVVWVILTSQEPYENAINQDQICQCVCQGSRPDVSLIPHSAPQEIVLLMKKCWAQNPQSRPTFQENFDSFCPFYKQNLEKDVDHDVGVLMDLYKGPSELVHMKSVMTDHGVSHQGFEPVSVMSNSSDTPATLTTSNSEPVEASQEDVDLLASGGLQVDAVRAVHASSVTTPTPATPTAPTTPDNLVQKLDQELNYHKFGSYTSEQFNNHPNSASQAVAGHRRDREIMQPVSSVQSWNTASPDRNPEEELNFHATESNPYDASYHPDYNSHMSLPFSQHSQYQPKPQFDRMQSCPDMTSDYKGACCPAWFAGTLSDRVGSLHISQSSGIQIGNNNIMHIRSTDSSSLSSQSSSTTSSKYKELLRRYGDHAITDEHLELVQKNLGSKWKSCARRLGLTEAEIDAIGQDYDRDGLDEKVHQMLLRWKMKEGLHGCTVGKLCRGLESSVKAEVIMNLLLGSQDGTVPSTEKHFNQEFWS